MNMPDSQCIGGGLPLPGMKGTDIVDWDNFNRPACYVTIKVKQGKVQSASCKCGRPIMGRGKTAERAAATHIKGWGAPYTLEHI